MPKTPPPSSLPQPRAVYVNELKAFLGHGDQRVLLLHGRWGTGKTYFWNNFVRTQLAFIENQFYSYVSLFGATSIAHVKGLIVLGGDTTQEVGLLEAGWRRTKKWLVRKRRYFEELKVPYLGSIGALLPKAEEILIQDFLVCFDDLERRNRELDIDQLFGLVAVLKEQNRCRVVIVCNEEELSARDRRTLNKYREKVIDRQLTFNPPFAENFRVIFGNDNVPIREVFERLQLNNIRVFQQTRWCVQYFEPHLKNCHEVFVQRYRQQCAKLAAAHFAYSNEVTLDEVKSTSWMLAGWEGRVGVRDPATDVISQLQFMPSKADDFIIGYLRDGYCNLAELRPIIETMNREYKRSEADMAVGRFWDNVWDAYSNDTIRVVEEAKALLNQYHALLPFKYTADVLKFAKRIDPTFDTESFKELAARSLIPDADLATLRDIIAECNSPGIQEAAKEKEASLKARRTIAELVVALGESDGWTPSDFALLNEYSEDELLQWTSTATGPNILFILAQAIARGQLESAENHKGNEVGRRFRRVFDKLAERSTLDAQRTKRTFDRIRNFLQQYGKEAPPEVCPREDGNESCP